MDNNKIDPRAFQAETVYEQQMAGVVGAGPSMANEAASVAQGLDREAVFAAMYARDPYWDAQGRSSAAAVRLALDVLAQAAPPAAPVQDARRFVPPAKSESACRFDFQRAAVQGWNECREAMLAAMLAAPAAPASEQECNCNACYSSRMVRGTADPANCEAPATGESGAEPIYQAMCTDDDNGKEDVWMDVSRDSFEQLSRRGDVRSRIVYATPPAAEAASATIAGMRVVVDPRLAPGEFEIRASAQQDEPCGVCEETGYVAEDTRCPNCNPESAQQDEREADIEKAFQAVYSGYNKARDTYKDDNGYVLFLRGRMSVAFGLLQRATGRAHWNPYPAAQQVQAGGEDKKDAERYQMCEDLCMYFTDTMGDRIGISLPIPSHPPLKSTAEVFRWIIDAALSREQPQGDSK